MVPPFQGWDCVDVGEATSRDWVEKDPFNRRTSINLIEQHRSNRATVAQPELDAVVCNRCDRNFVLEMPGQIFMNAGRNARLAQW